MEGMTECGQCLLCFYQFGIAGIMVVELLLALVLMFWATNQMGIITDLQGGDVSEGSLTHTINYNLGNNFVNCSFNDCCPPLLEKKEVPGFRKIVDGIYELNDTWPEATCVRPGDECTDEKREQGLCEEELALAPATDAVNNSNTIVSPSSSSGEIITQDNENEGGNANAGSAPSSGAALTDADVEPLQQAEHNGRQQMCMLFEPVQNKENCWDLELYDKKLREYFWGLLEPFSTVILVV